MSSGNYLKLLEGDHKVSAGVPYFMSSITLEKFTSYGEYIGHFLQHSYDEFISYFNGQQGTLSQCVLEDIESLEILERCPLSYTLAVLISYALQKDFQRTSSYAFPGDIIECEGKKFAIVGKQDEGFIGKCFDSFDIPITFTSEKAVFAGKMGLFLYIKPQFDTRYALTTVRNAMHGCQWMVTEEIERYAEQQFNSEIDSEDLLFKCFSQLREGFDSFKEELAEFGFLRNEDVCLRFLRVEQSSEAIDGLLDIAERMEFGNLSGVSYKEWKVKNGEPTDSSDEEEIDIDKRAVKPLKLDLTLLTPADEQFETFLKTCSFEDILINLHVELSVAEETARNDDRENEEAYYERLITLLENGAKLTMFDDKLLGLYEFFFWSHDLLKLPRCSFEQFLSVFAYPAEKGLYNDEVHPFQYEFLCRLVSLLFRKEVDAMPNLEAHMHSGEWVLAKKDSSTSSYCSSDDSTEASENITALSLTDVNDSIANEKSEVSNEESSESDHSYYYSDDETEYISESYSSDDITPRKKEEFKKKQKTSETSDSEYNGDGSGSCSDDYVIAKGQRPRKNSKQLFNARKKELIKRKKEESKEAFVGLPQVARNIDISEADDISDTLVEQSMTNQTEITEFFDIVRLDANLDAIESGSTDQDYIEEIIYYIAEVSLPEKDVFALQFICPLLNHLTHKFDEVFHSFYKKFDNSLFYMLNSERFLRKYRLMHAMCSEHLRDLWVPEIGYPWQQFLRYGVLLQQPYQPFEEQMEMLETEELSKPKRMERYDICHELFINHPVTRFADLSIELKVALCSFIASEVEKCDKFQGFIHNGSEEHHLALNETRQELRRAERNYQSLRNEYLSEPRDITFEEYIEEYKADLELKIERLEQLVRKEEFNMTSGSSMWIGDAQVLVSDHTYIETFDKAVFELSGELAEDLSKCLKPENRFLVSEHITQPICYSTKDIEPIRITQRLGMEQINRVLMRDEEECMSAYNLNNELGFGQMRLSAQRFMRAAKSIK